VNSWLSWSDFSKYQDFLRSNKMSILNLNYCVVGLGKFTIALQSFEVYFSPCCCIAAFEEFRGLTLKVLN